MLTATLAIVALLGGTQLISVPPLYAAAALGLAGFKGINLEYHLRQRAGWAKLDRYVRFAIYFAPALFLAQTLFYAVGLTRVWWGADVVSGDEYNLDILHTLLLATTGALVLLDAGLMIVRHNRRGEDSRAMVVGF